LGTLVAVTSPAPTARARVAGSPRTSADPVEIADALRYAVLRLARLLRQQDDSGLPPALLAALATIDREGPITLGDLASAERLTPPSITKVVATLEDDGLVERAQDGQDRRVWRVRITAKGRRRLEASRTAKTAWLATRLHELDADALARLAAAIDVLEALARAPAPARSGP
jgi:DNA-binding MarR family transcriptional regulator